jgi:hypothetical protein
LVEYLVFDADAPVGEKVTDGQIVGAGQGRGQVARALASFMQRIRLPAVQPPLLDEQLAQVRFGCVGVWPGLVEQRVCDGVVGDRCSGRYAEPGAREVFHDQLGAIAIVAVAGRWCVTVGRCRSRC